MRSFVAEGAPQDDGQNRWSGDSQRREETDAWLPGRAGQKRWEHRSPRVLGARLLTVARALGQVESKPAPFAERQDAKSAAPGKAKTVREVRRWR
jgi:hypothetical protein